MKIAGKDGYCVRLDVFEGPLDLLLYLIKREEVDIHDIHIGRIAEQYLEYIDLMRVLDLNIAGEFLVMASTLMLIKSRMLLPEDEHEQEEEDEGDDPRWDLVRQLVEYKKFKDAALHLHRLEQQRLDIHPRGAETVVPAGGLELALRDVSLFDLMTVFHDALQRTQDNTEIAEIFSRTYSVTGKIEDLRRCVRGGTVIRLQALFGSMTSRDEVICTFLAMLELMRRGELEVRQEHAFEDIFIEGRSAGLPAISGQT